jgi:SAM-dependent methyltransferase
MPRSRELHREELNRNRQVWRNKPLLRRVYNSFFDEINLHLTRQIKGSILELGSGVSGIKSVIPDCICTDIFPGEDIDRVESAYALNFANESVSNLILFDVFHHLRYPGTALDEIYRVLKNSARLILFEPCISLVGHIVYGIFHQEPVALNRRIDYFAPDNWKPENSRYYAAQGNAYRIFVKKECPELLKKWKLTAVRRIPAFSYIASGGYQNWQLYPLFLLPAMQGLDRVLAPFPSIFACRLLVVLEKTNR